MKRRLSSIWKVSLALVLVLSFVTLPVTTALAVAPTSDADIEAVSLTATTRLVATQNNDGGWEWQSPDDDPGTGTPSPNNTLGVTAQGVLDTYKLTQNPANLAVCELTYERMVVNSDDADPAVHRIRGTDIPFLVEYSEVTGLPAYAQFAKARWDDAVTEFGGGTATGFAGYVRDARVAQGWPALVAWDIDLYLQGVLALNRYFPGQGYDAQAAEMAEVIYNYLYVDDPGFDLEATDTSEYWLTVTGAIEAFATTGTHGDAMATLLAVLLANQQLDGSFLGVGDGWATQTTAYAVMALLKVGQIDAARAGVEYLESVQFVNGGIGDEIENTEVTSEVTQAVCDFIQAAGRVSLDRGQDGTIDVKTLTIQLAIDSASAGDEINVAPGHYVEEVLITKPLTVLGATADVDKFGYPVPETWDDTVESIISHPDPSGGYDAIVDIYDVSDVIFSGFVVQELNAVSNQNTSLVRVRAQTQPSNHIVISNNIIGPNTNTVDQDGTHGRMGLYLVNNPYSDEFGITNSIISGNKIFGCEGNGNNIFIWSSYYEYGAAGPASMSGTVITGNEIYGSHRSGIETAGGFSGLTIANNSIYGNFSLPGDTPELKYGNGMLFVRGSSDKVGDATTAYGPVNLTIVNNDIYGNARNGIYMGPINTNYFIAGNEIHANGWDGIIVDLEGQYWNPTFEDEPDPWNEHACYDGSQNVFITVNNIYGNAGYGARVIGSPTNGFMLNANINWWGSAQGPGRGGANGISGSTMANPWLPGTWQTYFSEGAEVDSDSDTYSDLEEYWLGTDPLDPEDYPGAPVSEVSTAAAEDGGTAETTTSNASVTVDAAEGESASVNLAEYTDTPIADESVFGAVGKYVDVHTDNADTLDEVEIRVYYDEGELTTPESSLRMYYWNAAVGDWRQCSDQGVNEAENYIWALIRSDTTPDLNYLLGGPFGGGAVSVELDNAWYKTGGTAIVTIEDDAVAGDGRVQVHLESALAAHTTNIWADEDPENPGLFIGTFTLIDALTGINQLMVIDGDTVTATYDITTATAGVDDTPPETINIYPDDGEVVIDNMTPIAVAYEDDNSGVNPASVVIMVDGVDVTGLDTEIDAGVVVYWTAAEIPDGEHFVTVDYSDMAGNVATQASWSFYIDTQAPVISDLAPADESFVNTATPTISAILSDGDLDETTIEMSLDGIVVDHVYDDVTGMVSYTPIVDLAEEEHIVTLTASDIHGNTSEVIWAFSVDVTDPVIAIDPVDTPTTVDTQALSGTFTELNLGVITVTVNGVEIPIIDDMFGTWTATEDVTLVEGENLVVASITDLAGTVVTDEVVIVLDTIEPTVTEAEISPSEMIKADFPEDIIFTVVVTDGGTGVTTVTIDLSLIGGSATQEMFDDGMHGDTMAGDGRYGYVWEDLTISDEGDYELPITATDGIANANDTVSVTLTVIRDTVAPEIHYTGLEYPTGYESARPTSPGGEGDQIQIFVVVTDDLAGVNAVTVDATEIGLGAAVDIPLEEDNTYYALLNIGEVEPGTKTLYITVTDKADNEATAELTVEVTPGLTAYNIMLNDGWNLISLPLIPPEDNTIEAVLDGISIRGRDIVEFMDLPVDEMLPEVLSIWSYDPVTDTWLSYIPDGPEPTLTYMSDGVGYWVDIVVVPETPPAILTVHGTQLPIPPGLPPAYDLLTGWNLIGFKEIHGMLSNEYLSGIEDSVVRIYGYWDGVYFVVHMGDPIYPGLGYWIAVTEPGTIYP